MKKIFQYSLQCLVAAVALLPVSCTDNESLSQAEAAIYASSVNLNLPAGKDVYLYTDATDSEVFPMIKGETLALNYQMLPDDVTFNEVDWASSNTEVATVDESGNVTAVAAGTAIITVSPAVFYSGSGIYGVLKVAVSENLIPAETITLTASDNSVYVGESVTVNPSILPATATYKTVKFTSSDERIATVDNKGLVTGVSSNSIDGQNVTITATALDANSTVSASVDISVIQVVQPQSVSLEQTFNKDNYNWAIGDKTYAIAYTTVPALSTKSLLQWTSSDENVATVSNGVVTFNQTGVFGEVTITATCPETGNSSLVTINLAEGLIRELFHNPNNITWDLTAAHKKSGGSSSWSYGKLLVTTYTVNATTQRGDFAKSDANLWLHAGNYPILAIRMTDVLADYSAEGVTARNISVDSNTADGSYRGTFGGGNNKWITRYKCSDGSYVFIYDLKTQTFATGGLLPTNASVKFSTLQWKYADIKSIGHQVNYSVYWVQTFKTLSDLQAYVSSEGLTWTE